MIYPKLSDGTIDWCVMCKNEGSDFYDLCCECEYPENPDDPPAKYEPKPITNADRIRAMTDEELAEWLNTMQSNAWHSGRMQKTPNKYPSTNQTWLGWLRQEATDDP